MSETQPLSIRQYLYEPVRKEVERKPLFANGGYLGANAATAAATQRLRLGIVQRPVAMRGFEVLPRW